MDLWIVVRSSRMARLSRLALVVGGPYAGPILAKRVANELEEETGVEHRIKPLPKGPVPLSKVQDARFDQS